MRPARWASVGPGRVAVKLDSARGPVWPNADPDSTLIDFAQMVQQRLGGEGFSRLQEYPTCRWPPFSAPPCSTTA
eukprot:10877474-Alexandrium_andersonii.AAC.1